MSLLQKVFLLTILAIVGTVVFLFYPHEAPPPAGDPRIEKHYLESIGAPDYLAPPEAEPSRPKRSAAAPPPPRSEPEPERLPPPQSAAALPPAQAGSGPDSGHSVQPQAPGSEPAATGGPVKRPGVLAVHRVKEGDSLYELAGKYYGDRSRWTLIRDANPSTRGSGSKQLRLGSQLVIPEPRR
jgi:nucleoid-associated protein YgaU